MSYRLDAHQHEFLMTSTFVSCSQQKLTPPTDHGYFLVDLKVHDGTCYAFWARAKTASDKLLDIAEAANLNLQTDGAARPWPLPEPHEPTPPTGYGYRR